MKGGTFSLLLKKIKRQMPEFLRNKLVFFPYLLQINYKNPWICAFKNHLTSHQ